MKTLYCTDFCNFKNQDHCSSCHNEWDDGFGSPCEFEKDGFEIFYCCKFSDIVEGMAKEDLLKAYNAKFE